ncbi:MAG: hypothetical protein ACAH95_18540 [Fimbriimonas sp.]
MQLKERIFSEPISFMFGCLIWIPLAIWIISLMRWMISGEVDLILGLTGMCMAVLLGYIAINPPAPQVSILAFVAVVVTMVMYPIVAHAMNKRSLKAMDVEDLERAYYALKTRPDNVAAKFKIARLLYDMGYPGHALRIAENCIAAMPQAFFYEEHRLIARWRITPTSPRAFDPIPCLECSQSNPPGNVNCAACGAPFLLDRMKGKVLPSTLGKRLMAAWIVMVAVLAGLPLIASIGGLVAVFGIFTLLVISVAVLLVAFRNPDRGVAA